MISAALAQAALLPRDAVRLLLVEADGVAATRFEATLQDGCPDAFRITRASSLARAHMVASNDQFDIVILDLELPDSHGFETLKGIREDVPNTVPIYVLTGLDGATDVSELLLHSGNEYLIKGQLDHTLLPRLILQAVDRQHLQINMLLLISTNPDGIVVIDKDGVVLFSNDKAAEQFGVTPEYLLGQSFGFPVICGSSVDINTRMNRVSEMRAVEIDWNGHSAHMITLRDVTERVNLMNELQAAKEAAETANRVRDEILSNMNHEVRTPLNSIIGFSDILINDEQEYSGKLAIRSYLDHINQSGYHLLDLLTEVLDMANIMTNHMDLAEEPFEVASAIRSVAQLVRSQVIRAGLKLEIDVSPQSLALFADQRRVKQMVSHLLSNAIKFNNPGGTVRLEVKGHDRGRIHFIVSDTGVGMDMSQITLAESPFGKLGDTLTSSTGGAGLGLSLTKGMIERHGGTLTIHSEPGKGTSVTLCFPASRAVSMDDPTRGHPASLASPSTPLEGGRMAIDWHKGISGIAATEPTR